MMQLKMLSTDDKLAEIKRLYFKTSAQTIKQDFDKAVDLLKSLANDDERERVAVYMDGLAEMRADWARREKRKAKPIGPGRSKKPRTADPKKPR